MLNAFVSGLDDEIAVVYHTDIGRDSYILWVKKSRSL